MITTWGWGAAGEAAADVTTMLINALISCAVFFPIFKIIFRREPEPEPEPGIESLRSPATVRG